MIRILLAALLGWYLWAFSGIVVKPWVTWSKEKRRFVSAWTPQEQYLVIAWLIGFLLILFLPEKAPWL